MHPIVAFRCLYGPMEDKSRDILPWMSDTLIPALVSESESEYHSCCASSRHNLSTGRCLLAPATPSESAEA